MLSRNRRGLNHQSEAETQAEAAAAFLREFGESDNP
jgi:hypothetical protein